MTLSILSPKTLSLLMSLRLRQQVRMWAGLTAR
jgi:hypothetical protein